MLSDATGLRAYDGVVLAVRPGLERRSDYAACKDAAEWANTLETRQLTALQRIITAVPLVAEMPRVAPSASQADGRFFVISPVAPVAAAGP
jgi:hypothetical protein